MRREDQRIHILRYDHPFNYSAINNVGAEAAKGNIICLMNNDIEVIGSDWLTEMVAHTCRPEIGCVGAKLLYPNDTIQHAGVITGLWGVAGHAHKHFGRHDSGYYYRAACTQNYSAVTAACLLVRKEVYRQVGGLNEAALPIAFNDVDFCLKVRQAGYRNLWTPHAELYHHESVSRGRTTRRRRKHASKAKSLT
ncbi:glycosyltransferase [Alkalilimnicola ehrlichii]|uniref:glycosyltransferase n=1 Tax=Alkalilimnicola ehrlichii TaxID=351052 RepID=UPI00384AC0A1